MKEPHEMTCAEWLSAVRAGRDFPQLGCDPTPLATLRVCRDFQCLDRQARQHHAAMVIFAFLDGKPVRPEILHEHYPEIKSAQAQVLPEGWKYWPMKTKTLLEVAAWLQARADAIDKEAGDRIANMPDKMPDRYADLCERRAIEKQAPFRQASALLLRLADENL